MTGKKETLRCVCGKFGTPYTHAGECTTAAPANIHTVPTPPPPPPGTTNQSIPPEDENFHAFSYLNMLEGSPTPPKNDTQEQALSMEDLQVWWSLASGDRFNFDSTRDVNSLKSFLDNLHKSDVPDALVLQFLQETFKNEQVGYLADVLSYNGVKIPPSVFAWFAGSPHISPLARFRFLIHPNVTGEMVNQMYSGNLYGSLPRIDGTDKATLAMFAKPGVPEWVVGDIVDQMDVILAAQFAKNPKTTPQVLSLFFDKVAERRRKIFFSGIRGRLRRYDPYEEPKTFQTFFVLTCLAGNPKTPKKVLEKIPSLGWWWRARMAMSKRYREKDTTADEFG